MKNNHLNVLTYGYYGGFRNVPNNIKQFFRNVRYAYQRVTKGYCDWDVWDLDAYYSNLFSSTLRDLAECTHGYPGTGLYSDEQAKKDGYIDGYDRWVKTLKEMAEHFDNAMEDTPNSYRQKSDELFNKYTKTLAEADRLAWNAQEELCANFRNNEKDKACDMLKEYFFNLWD